jgi:hypothetical protein
MEFNPGVKKRKKVRGDSFKPDHKFISEAVLEFLKKGGEIKKIEANDRNLDKYVKVFEDPSSADDFLRGV